MSKVNRVSKQQIMEWIENPVTIAFRQMCEVERDESMGQRGWACYKPFDPSKTQELLASLNGYVDAWDYAIDALKGEGLWELDDEK